MWFTNCPMSISTELLPALSLVDLLATLGVGTDGESCSFKEESYRKEEKQRR